MGSANESEHLVERHGAAVFNSPTHPYSKQLVYGSLVARLSNFDIPDVPKSIISTYRDVQDDKRLLPYARWTPNRIPRDIAITAGALVLDRIGLD